MEMPEELVPECEDCPCLEECDCEKGSLECVERLLEEFRGK